MNPTELIQSRLNQLEAEYGLRILHAVESGSRAWGFASEDSDYDVRFLYVWPTARYLSISESPESLELGVDENNLDLSGWDLRKALRLFCRSNGPLLEWLHSPVVYRTNAEEVDRWRSLVPGVLSPKSLAGHYAGLAKRLWNGANESGAFTAKRYLYIIRGVLSARHVATTGTVAPVSFQKLREVVKIDLDLQALLDDMIAAKEQSAEKDRVDRVDALDLFVESELQSLSSMIEGLSEREPDMTAVDEFFRSVVLEAGTEG